jgi:hypothetical protein
MSNRIIASGHPFWSIDYHLGSRLADIRYIGHAVDCVQVRDWDWTLSPCDQTSDMPDHESLMRTLADWIAEHGQEYAS